MMLLTLMIGRGHGLGLGLGLRDLLGTSTREIYLRMSGWVSCQPVGYLDWVQAGRESV